MIRSMTAFARKDTRGDWGTLTCEIRTVNHRYLEPSFRLPEAFRELENLFRGACSRWRARCRASRSAMKWPRR